MFNTELLTWQNFLIIGIMATVALFAFEWLEKKTGTDYV